MNGPNGVSIRFERIPGTTEEDIISLTRRAHTEFQAFRGFAGATYFNINQVAYTALIWFDSEESTNLALPRILSFIRDTVPHATVSKATVVPGTAITAEL